MDKPRGQWTTVTWLPFREEVIGGGAKSIVVDLGAAAFVYCRGTGNSNWQIVSSLLNFIVNHHF